MERIPRVKSKWDFLIFAVGAVFMGTAAGEMLTKTSWGDPLSALEMFAVTMLFVWFSGVGLLTLFGLTALHSISVDHEQIRVHLGPLTICRIPADRIKTVGLSAIYAREYESPKVVLLTLSSRSVEDLNEKGSKFLNNKRVLDRMGRCGLSTEDRNAAARAWLFESGPMAVGIPLWLEDSDEARFLLRKHLTTAVFLL